MKTVSEKTKHSTGLRDFLDAVFAIFDAQKSKQHTGQIEPKWAEYAFELESELGDAVSYGDMDMVRQLLNKGASVNQAGFMMATPLMHAAKSGNTQMAALLLSYPECDPNLMNAGGTSALMIAARLGDEEMVRLLMDDPRTDINILSKHGSTALHQAASMGHVAVTDLFLARADIQIHATFTQKKHTPASAARWKGHDVIAQRLEEFEPTPGTGGAKKQQ